MAERLAVGGRADGVAYEELLDRARRTAAVLTAAGVERVGFVDVNSVLLPQVLFGAGIAGLPFAPVNYRLADDRLRAVARRPGAGAGGGRRRRGRAASPASTASPSSATPTSRPQVAAATGDDGPALTDPDEVAVWLFTSGTTGEPKAALLRHRHLTSYVLSTVEFMGADEDEAALVSVPPYHIAGVAAILSGLFSGRRIVYLPAVRRRPSGSAWPDEEGITHAMVVPTMLGRILDAVEASGERPARPQPTSPTAAGACRSR